MCLCETNIEPILMILKFRGITLGINLSLFLRRTKVQGSRVYLKWLNDERNMATTYTFYTITADSISVPSLRPVSAFWRLQPDVGNVTNF